MEGEDFRSLSERVLYLNPNQSTPITLEPRGANATRNTEQALVRHPLNAYQHLTIHVSLQADASIDDNENIEGAYDVLYPPTTETIFYKNNEILALPPGSDSITELSAIVVRLAPNPILVNNEMLTICLFIRTSSSRPITSAAATSAGSIFYVWPELRPADAHTK